MNAGKPELVVFAILGNFKKQNPQAVISDIVQELKRLTHGPLHLKKYTSQLRILSKLRKFEDLTFKIIKDMPLLFDVANDHLFIKGKVEGKEEGEVKGIVKGIEIHRLATVINMMLKTDLSLPKIADLSSVKIEEVEKLKKELDKTTAKKVMADYQQDKLSLRRAKERANRLARELLKMPSLSHSVIAVVVDWEEKELQAFIRKEQKEAQNKKKQEEKKKK